MYLQMTVNSTLPNLVQYPKHIRLCIHVVMWSVRLVVKYYQICNLYFDVLINFGIFNIRIHDEA